MRPSTRFGWLLSACVLGALAASVAAEWDPDNAEWGKSDPLDVRVMTWNIDDAICSTADKQEADNDSWCAMAHIIAALKPDILIMQEAGDNSGNGTGSGVDSTADLYTTIDLFLHGGSDVFNGGVPVTAYVQKYDASYDLPYAFVSIRDDNYNRNVLLSRFPFVDLNGDGSSRYSDIPAVLGDEYAPGGNGGIRGFMFAEIELDDLDYCGDLVVGNAHLKSGSGSDEQAERLTASQNVAYVIDYWYNGAGEGIPDPHNRINDYPNQAQTILGDYTPVVIGGDWNEDEQYNGRRGPADWLTQAEYFGSDDGTDRDRSDMTYDAAEHYYTGSRITSGSSKLDYLAWQDSIAALRRAFVFYTSGTPAGSLPAEILSYAVPSSASYDASPHRPVIADLDPPVIGGGDCDECIHYVLGDCNGDGNVNTFDIDPFVFALTDSAGYIAQYGEPAYYCQCDITGDGNVNTFDIDAFVALLTGAP